MKRTDLLNTMRPGKQRQAVEMALRPNGVTGFEMVVTLGNPLINALRSLDVQGLATLVRLPADGAVAYHLVTDEHLTPDALRKQHARREAFKRMQAEPEPDADDEY